MQQRLVTITDDGDDMGTANQPIQSALGDDGVGEEGVPVFGRAVGCDYHGAIAIAPVNKLVKVLGLEGAQLFQGEIIKDKQLWFEIAS